MASQDSFGAKSTLDVDGTSYEIFRLDAVSGEGLADDAVKSLPYSLKVLLENLLRTEDGSNITADDIMAIAGWDPDADPSEEIQFTPARVIMQDFTGVPCVVDLATMREAMEELGGDPTKINPLAPAEMVIDHSVIADVFGTPGRSSATSRSSTSATTSATNSCVGVRAPSTTSRWSPRGPGSSIRSTSSTWHAWSSPARRTARRWPTPTPAWAPTPTPPWSTASASSGWGVGGIEAEAAMLGQPVSMLLPRVVGFKLSGDLTEGTTATDLVLTITEMLREHGVVGKFVEFYGPGVSALPLANRATIGNMSPEFGSTIAVFPIDEETDKYLG